MSDPTASTPAATASIHGLFLEKAIPDWLVNATPERRAALKNSATPTPDWLKGTTRAQRDALGYRATASFAAQTRLDKAMSAFLDVDTFARPLLVKALKDRFSVTLDVDKTLVCLRQPLEWGVLGVDIGSFEVLRLPLLQAALHNFEASETEGGAFHESSGFLVENPTPGTFSSVSTTLTVTQFTGLCRSLDIGAKYQVYLKAFFKTADAEAEKALRQPFIESQKAALRAAADLALLKKDITPADYTMIVSVIDGEVHPWMGKKQVWFRDLCLMNLTMTGCVVFYICEKYRYGGEMIVYIPNDPEQPLKRYLYEDLTAMFKRRFTARDAGQPRDGSPTQYQRFFSQFVAYGDLARYFNEFTQNASGRPLGQKLSPYASILNTLLQGINPFAGFKKLPPTTINQEPNDDPFLAPRVQVRAGQGLWVENIDLWGYLYEQHRDKVLADARSHAVPTADVDARVRSEKFAFLLNIGMLVLTTVSMFVPVLGEVMLVAIAGQLMSETFEASIEWSEGDRKAAKAHLIDVAENLAFFAVAAGVGKGLAKLTAVKAEPVIEQLDPVTLPNGDSRLWKADLKGYERAVSVDRDVPATDLGQFEFDGKTHVRIDNRFYQKTYDPQLKRWRIKHPSDPQAYQPPLAHNGTGAWRHTLERPQTWDRLTLLRRIGPVTDTFSDQRLLQIADVSGVSDSALRKMHLDNAPPPPELTDALRLFEADHGVAQVIEQIETGQAIDDRYLFTLPLVTELPRWPVGRVLKVFEGPELSGKSLKYGSERLYPGVKLKPAIRITRADVLSGNLPALILAGLEESEITRLLGGEPARVKALRPQELRKQIADFARTRQPALFESLYKGLGPVDPRVAKLQRLCPGLSESAAISVLDDATVEELTRLEGTARLSLRLLEQARWYVQQGRLTEAFAGLHMENLVWADSKRLALHILEKLPGWKGDVRLEIREGGIEGELLDGIGNENSGNRKFVVKKGPFYQAFNERGETLNSLPRTGDNFFASILHALPDDARQSLGIPSVGQSADLRRAVIDYATAHPTESAQWLRDKTAARPPRRIAQKQWGYLSSGRGADATGELTSRVQDVYPDLSDVEALKFLLEQWGLGQSNQQIYHLLSNRLREWQALEATLDQWVGGDSALRAMLDGKGPAADAIKSAWKNSPKAGANPRYARLELSCHDSLPPLSADFSHIRELSVGGVGMTSATIEGLLGSFQQLEKLSITGSMRLRTVPRALDGMEQLTDLSLASNFPYSAAEIARLENLVRLEKLELRGVLQRAEDFDVSRLSNLRSLTITSATAQAWPAGVLELPHLERLNMRGSFVYQLPGRLFEGGHDRLLSGLSLDWSWLTRETFKVAYDYVRSQPVHLIDLEEMVADHCRGQLRQFGGAGETSNAPGPGGERSGFLFQSFLQRWEGAEARFNAIEALGDQYDVFYRRLHVWLSKLYVLSVEKSWDIGAALRSSWHSGLLRRYGSTDYSTRLKLNLMSINQLPELAARDFEHVETLILRGGAASLEETRRFVSGFNRVQNLDLSGSRFADAGTSSVGLDVSAMSELKALNLNGTNLQVWPTGAENLAELTWLDLGGTAITTLPEAALARDDLVIGTHLSGAPLTPQALQALSAARARVELSKGLPPGALERFDREPVPQDFPPTETGASIAGNLWPLPAQVPAGEGTAWLAQRLKAVRWMVDDEPLHAIEKLRKEGLGSAQISERIDGWHRTLEDLTRRLNGWLFTRGTRGTGWDVSAHSRRLAALRIIECWQESLIGWNGVADHRLDFNGLQLGDLPELALDFPHVGDLNLTGVRLTGQGSNGFLNAFPHVHSLALGGQPLHVLPRALESMSALERLDLSSTGLLAPENIYSALGSLEQLRMLDLSYNNLQSFSVESLPRLEELDLRNNRITDWPEGVLQADHLRVLNLSGNRMATIPEEALDGHHDVLMAHTDVSDNSFSRHQLEQIRDYGRSVTPNAWLGYTPDLLDELIDDLGSDGEDEVHPVLPDEVITHVEAEPEQLKPWLEMQDPMVVAERRALWNRLAAEPDNGAFFHLLALLQLTPEFRLARADLTRRMWVVASAAGEDSELREILFGMSSTHGTCVDGRILTFSELEVKVFERNVLQDIAPGQLEQRGRALLRLGRQLFRLNKVEDLAKKARGYTDQAEARLEYRIGLTQGWSDGLELPGQPRNMQYGRPISGTILSTARATIEALEKTEAFYENLIGRDFWVQFLREKYPEEFSVLDQSAADKQSRFEDDHAHETVGSDAYKAAVETLNIELSIERNQKLIELSRRVTGEAAPAVSAQPQPGTSRNLMVPPRR